MKIEYKPIVVKNMQLEGITAHSQIEGGTVDIIRKKFTSSLSENFPIYYNNLIGLFPLTGDPSAYLNGLLVIIKPDKTAFIYTQFPLSFNIKASTDLKAGQPVYKNDIADLISVAFSDTENDLNPDKGDQIIWLFRNNWHFGLYFDFTRLQEKEDLLKDMGYHYKRIMYHDLYNFLSQQKNFNELINDGWFPFIKLLGGQFDNLIKFYAEDKKFDFHLDNILDYFSKERITDMMNFWWTNPTLNNKKEIIQAGIEAYLSKTSAGYINCIKNLISEMEGIIRMAYYKETGKDDLTTNKIKQYIVDSGKKEFNTLASLGFTNEFLSYLNEFVFDNFDVANGKIPDSRHSYAHGVATNINYSQIRALQLILTIDQICYFLGHRAI